MTQSSHGRMLWIQATLTSWTTENPRWGAPRCRLRGPMLDISVPSKVFLGGLGDGILGLQMPQKYVPKTRDAFHKRMKFSLKSIKYPARGSDVRIDYGPQKSIPGSMGRDGIFTNIHQKRNQRKNVGKHTSRSSHGSIMGIFFSFQKPTRLRDDEHQQIRFSSLVVSGFER